MTTPDVEIESLLTGLLNAADLDRMTFPPLTEHVPGIIVEGFTLFGGPPKVGKSWMVGAIACGIASGGVVLGKIPVKARPVLLASLEDSPRRLQSRLRKIMCDQPLPENLDILTDVNPLVLLATIAEWLQRHGHASPTVILDTLGKARRAASTNGNQYQEDYGFAGSIKHAIDAFPGSALVAVHHTRKQAADDFLDTVSGTQGIAGAADSVVVLARKRKSDEGILAVTGRDIEENEYAVRTDGGLWSLDGDDIMAAAATVNTRREQAAQNRMGDRSFDALKFVNSRVTTKPAELAEFLGIDNKIAGNVLAKLFDREEITKTSWGTYAPLGGETGETDETPVQGHFVGTSGGGESETPNFTPTDSFHSGEIRNHSLAGTSLLSPDSPPTCTCGVPLTTPQSLAANSCAECRLLNTEGTHA